jgi:hypothetical protein
MKTGALRALLAGALLGPPRERRRRERARQQQRMRGFRGSGSRI